MGKIDLGELASKNPRVKYACVKNILATAKENPAEVYPDLEFFIRTLDNESRILRWTAIDVIGHLARVDKARKIDAQIQRLLGFLNSGNLITANHAIAALAEIAVAKPAYKQQINDEILKIEYYRFETEECRNIAIGKAILAIGQYFDSLELKDKTIDFVRRQSQNKRNATRKKAEQFLKRV